MPQIRNRKLPVQGLGFGVSGLTVFGFRGLGFRVPVTPKSPRLEILKGKPINKEQEHYSGSSSLTLNHKGCL